MRILIAGSSGFLGTRLVDSLTADGHDVCRLVRRAPTTAAESRWDPAKGQLDRGEIEAADAVINLAGASIGVRRWTEAYKRKLLDSRLDTTSTLVNAIAGAAVKPKVLLNASGVHVYAGAGPDDTVYDEQSPSGTGFLTELCHRWEGAAAPAADAGVRVAYLRTGIPLDKDGGFLKPIALLFKLGGGGKLGDGHQYFPWISLPDWIGATTFLLERDDIAGPVNMTGPEPVTNAEFTRTLGRFVHRPTLIPVPTVCLKAALGEFADVALASLRVEPGVLAKAGYPFRHRDVASALRWGLEHRDESTRRE